MYYGITFLNKKSDLLTCCCIGLLGRSNRKYSFIKYSTFTIDLDFGDIAENKIDLTFAQWNL